MLNGSEDVGNGSVGEVEGVSCELCVCVSE